MALSTAAVNVGLEALVVKSLGLWIRNIIGVTSSTENVH